MFQGACFLRRVFAPAWVVLLPEGSAASWRSPAQRLPFLCTCAVRLAAAHDPVDRELAFCKTLARSSTSDGVATRCLAVGLISSEHQSNAVARGRAGASRRANNAPGLSLFWLFSGEHIFFQSTFFMPLAGEAEHRLPPRRGRTQP